MAVNTLKNLCCCCCREQTLSLEEEALYPSTTINPSERLLSISTVTSFESSTESRCLSMNSSIGYDRSQYESNFTRSFQAHDGAQDIKQSPQLECFIIPSFGKDPPDNVAVKKMAGDFLKGVGKDFDIIQQLIKEDGHKQLFEVRFMCHFAQKKVEEFKSAIGDAMKSLKLKRDQKGLLIWYTGHGEKGTGNWIFQGGNVKFEDIYSLYIKCFKGRHLYIVSDCCYSGSWVVECARLLDKDGIKCGHTAKRQNVYIKVFTACLPNETAYDKYYTQCKGVKLHSHPTDRSKTIKFAVHRKIHYKSSADSHTTLGVDFTQNDSSMCLLDGDGKCTHYETWTEHVQQLIARKCSHEYLV